MYRGRVLTIGAGLSSAVIARRLAENGYAVDVAEERSHVAGNCHTVTDSETGVLVHVHGPHIFHTNDEAAWAYVNQFSHFRPYVTRVKATLRGQVSGQFNSCVDYGSYSGLWVSGECFACWFGFELSFPDEGERCIAQV